MKILKSFTKMGLFFSLVVKVVT